VTSAIRQAGANQVSVITSSAEREAAVELAKAAVIRPATLRQMFQEVAGVPAVGEALFQILEAQRMIASGARLTLLPASPHGRALSTLLAAESSEKAPRIETRRELGRIIQPPVLPPTEV